MTNEAQEKAITEVRSCLGCFVGFIGMALLISSCSFFFASKAETDKKLTPSDIAYRRMNLPPEQKMLLFYKETRERLEAPVSNPVFTGSPVKDIDNNVYYTCSNVLLFRYDATASMHLIRCAPGHRFRIIGEKKDQYGDIYLKVEAGGSVNLSIEPVFLKIAPIYKCADQSAE